MANYYYVEIKSEKLTQEVAAEIFNHIMRHQRVRWFNFSESGSINYNSRGLEDISEILEKYGITEEEIKVEDEFERFYNSLSPEELKQMEEEHQHFKKEHGEIKCTGKLDF